MKKLATKFFGKLYKRIKMGELAFTYIGQIFGLLTVSNNCTRILIIWSGEAFFNSMYIIKIYKNLNWKESKILYYMQFVCVKITNQCILHIRQLILFLWCISMDRIGNFVTIQIQTFGKHPYFFFFFFFFPPFPKNFWWSRIEK